MGAHRIDNSQADSRVVLDSIRRIVRVLRVFDREAEKRAGLSGAQVFVLQKLGDGDGISINELARRTHTHQSSVSVVAGKLVERKLVSRARGKADGRRAELTLTAGGRRTLGVMPAAAQDRLIAALGRFSVPGRRQLARLLAELIEKTGIGDEKPALFFEEAAGPGDAKRRQKNRK